jgi:arylsulfatase A-like enzyme
MTDEHHAGCLGFAGHPFVQTPNLDALAQRGAWFRNAFTCSAICAPSRTSFMTGTYLRTHNQFDNYGDLRRDLPHMVSEARKAGYRTGVCGKSGVPDKIFQHFEWAQISRDNAAYLKAKGLEEVKSNPEFNQKFESGISKLPYKEHEIAWTADRAIDFLTDRGVGEQPFLLWCSFGPPHSPHIPPKELDDLYQPEQIPVDWDAYERFERSRLGQRAMIEDFWKIGSVRHDPGMFQKAVCRYLALITMVDRELGRVLQTLEDQGLAEDTIVVFTADHGDFAGNFGQLGKNIAGYDDLLRIPLIYYDPARQDHGRCVESLCQSVDLFPTLCERLGLEVPPSVQGESLYPALDGCPGAGRDYIFAETHNTKTIRNHNWKLNFYGVHPHQGELHRVGPGGDETDNLWDAPACAHIKTELMTELTAWMIRCEQAHSMCWKAEEFMRTRWYDWLRDQPHESEDRAHWINVV